MAYVPSHQELRDHPKTKRAARKAGVPVPAMIGHLHLLWWWALDHAPDGDLSKFDADDLADAAMWESDPETFVKALRDCGPGDSEGFLEDGGRLHDWDDYGGKYGKRVQAARKAAAARWHSDDDAPASGPQCDGNANASDADSDGSASGNAEERRGEEKKETKPSRKRSDQASRLPDGWTPEPEPDLIAAIGGQAAADRQLAIFRDYWPAQPGAKGRKVDWQATWRNWLRRHAEDRRPQNNAPSASGLVR